MTKYRLKNSGWEYLSRKDFIKEVVEKYVSENTNKSFDELNLVFSGIHERSRGRGPAGVIKKTTDTRYKDFPGEYKIIRQRLNDGTEIAVYQGQEHSSAWGENSSGSESSFSKFLRVVEQQMGYEPEKDESSDNETNSQEHNNFIGGNNMPNLSLNQILYGPPGTGKTYDTVNKALEIINNEFFKENEIKDNDTIEQKRDKRELLVNEFNKYRKEGRIEFVTFHQNYSYEDFIQGIKPDITNGDSLSFERNNGLFYKICKRALNNKISSGANGQEIKRPFEQVFMELIESLSENDTPIEIRMRQSSYKIIEITEKSIHFKKQNGESSHTLSIGTLEKMYNSGVNNIIIGGLQPYYNPLLELLLERSTQNTREELKNYVIIIDEINRANISRVFGELITLIEDDKRWAGFKDDGKLENPNQMEVTLPSGELFTVPSNLYIIGTMNTADKSIALLDIALRRRFKFIPMYPKYELIEDTNLKEILKEMNMAIKEKKGTDFMIGHSFFINKKFENLENLVNNDLLPLISEYFNNKEKDIKKIFKEAGITVKENEQTFQLEFKDDSELNPATENNESN